jgi:uncharacterized protein (TIGR02246 family)
MMGSLAIFPLSASVPMSRHSWLSRVVPVALTLGLATPAIVAAQGVEEPRIPLRTALMELNTLRTEYAEAFNRKDAAAVASVYSSDAVIIDGRGARVSGADAIRQYIDARASEGGHMVLASDSVRVYGNTAVDVGTVTIHPEGGGEAVADYMAVSRRGMTGWKLVSVAVVPRVAE